MSDDRKRRIIKGWDQKDPAPEETPSPGQPAPPGEKLLDKTVYIPAPLIFLGFFAIALMSFSATYLIMSMAPDLDLPENQELLAYREAAAETTLALREVPGTRAKGVAFPSPDVSVMGYRSLFPDARTAAVSAPPRGFNREAAAKIAPPVINLRPKRPGQKPTAVVTAADIPGLRAGKGPFPGANPVKPPVTELVPGTFAQSFEIPALTPAPQKLMPRRFAKTATRPEPAAGVNPLTIPGAGTMPGVREVSLTRAREVGAPVSDLGADSFVAKGQVVAVTQKFGYVPKGEGSFPTPAKVENPVADLKIKPGPRPAIRAKGQTPDQKLMARRFAKATSFPEANGDANPLTQALEGGVLEQNSRDFSRALGISDPAATLVLVPGKTPEISAPAAVPGQKLMVRRYAKATVIPERLPGETRPTQDRIEPALSAPPRSQDSSLEPWRRFAAAVPANINGKGRIVIIIDDMGNNTRMAEALAKLSGPLNFAFLPYAPNLDYQTRFMRDQGHELLVHMPMEPRGDENPGPRALTTALSDTELQETLDWNLSRFEGFVGVNNHMGSRFTADSRRMDLVMRTLKDRGLLFLDSITTSNSKGESLAAAYNIPWAGRDIFLDNVPEEEAILAQLEKVEALAKHKGIAIAIGHPNSVTLKALREWIPTLGAKGLVLVPLSSVVHEPSRRKLAGGQD